MQHLMRKLVTLMVLAAAACSGEKAGPSQEGTTSTPSSPASRATLNGDTIVVGMYSDVNGNYYQPAEIEAEKGDVIRFVLKSGVHNVNFLPDSNTIKTGLPPASELLQLPDQTYDLVVTLDEGDYYFQCDPHAALGMKGKLEVEDD